MKRTTVKIPDELETRLRHEARRRGVGMSDVVREAIEAHVGRRRLRSIGAGRSGRSDISERIEQILASETKR
jgi:predicted transcriptional regulator